jgi:hypothetical protein
MRFAVLLVVVLVLVLVAPAHAQPSVACTLLQVGEIESALGGKASTKLSGASQKVPGMAIDTCSVELGVGKAGVRTATINIVKDLPMDAGELLRTRNGGTAREGQWQRTGVRFEQQTVGNAICIMARRPGVVGHSICSIPRAKEFVEVDVTAPVQELPSLDTVGALVQKAATRR